MVDELSAPDALDFEEDPYHLYLLRQPAERSSCVVPHLPKHPTMADTRLRYRRIPPEARSGSIGSLGGHFPARFEFPNRSSLLESLTSDDEAGSFAVRRPRRDLDKPRRRKKKRASRTIPPLPPRDPHVSAKPPLSADPDDPRTEDLRPADHNHPSNSSTPVSTSPTTPVPGSPVAGTIAPALQAQQEGVPEAAALRLAAGHPPAAPEHDASAPASPQQGEPQVVPKKRRTLSPRKIMCPHRDGNPRPADPAVARRAHSAHKAPPAPFLLDSKKSCAAPASASTPTSPRRTHSTHTRASPPTDGISVLHDGRPISAPAAMHPSLRQNFVLRPEEPVQYSSSRYADGSRRTKAKAKSKAGHRKKRKDAAAGSTRNQMDVHRTRRKEQNSRQDPDEDMFARDKDMSVSFANRRYTAEEAAVKPLNAIQRLLHALAFAKISAGGRGKRTRTGT